MALSPKIAYRLARHIVDGADVAWIARHHGVAGTEIEEAWCYCRARLFQALDLPDDTPDQGILDRADEAIRLLLSWEERTSYVVHEQTEDQSMSDRPNQVDGD